MGSDNMKKFGFLLGQCDLDYKIPENKFSPAGTVMGESSFKEILDGKYVLFEYTKKADGKANGIFAWDDKIKASGMGEAKIPGFLSATINFIDEGLLAMNWHDRLLVQTFVKENQDKAVLKMEYPSLEVGHKPVLVSVFTRKTEI